jgi:hypothetical protein
LKEKEMGGRKERTVSEDTEVVARGLTENWVKQHSREVSEKGRKEKVGSERKEKAKSEKKDAVEGWGQGADAGGWGGANW